MALLFIIVLFFSFIAAIDLGEACHHRERTGRYDLRPGDFVLFALGAPGFLIASAYILSARFLSKDMSASLRDRHG